jgi:hydrogenase maturation protease
MAASTASRGGPGPIRVLCLGNELVADDALGIAAAGALCERLTGLEALASTGAAPDSATTVRHFAHSGAGAVEVMETALTGMYLLDAVVGARRLIVVDTVVTGKVEPGTVLLLGEGDLVGARGGSPHYIGIFETLDLARALGLATPGEVAIVAVEAGDFSTVGGEMTPPVASAVPAVVDQVLRLIEADPGP